MESNKISVLADPRAGDLSLVSIDDTTKESVETTLSLKEAWELVTKLNVEIQRLTLLKPEEQETYVGFTEPTPAEKALAAPYKRLEAIDLRPLARPTHTPKVKEAVRESIGAPDLNRPRYSKPGPPIVTQVESKPRFEVQSVREVEIPLEADLG